jgi:protein-L-isoaspartate(D-aspartate) O-methyltransferase
VLFDAIVVAAAAPAVPANLPQLLADGGRLVVPVGSPERQRLIVVTRSGDNFSQQAYEDVVFVPLKSGQE